jgi:acetyl esterase/lipase
MSLDSKQIRIALQILIYPVADLGREWPSYERNKCGYMLTADALRCLRDSHAVDPPPVH